MRLQAGQRDRGRYPALAGAAGVGNGQNFRVAERAVVHFQLVYLTEVEIASGRLRALGHQSTEGKTPRNFGIDPTGAYLIVANQDADSLVVFRIDPKTGELTPTGNVVEVPKPVCVKMIAPK